MLTAEPVKSHWVCCSTGLPVSWMFYKPLTNGESWLCSEALGSSPVVILSSSDVTTYFRPQSKRKGACIWTSGKDVNLFWDMIEHYRWVLSCQPPSCCNIQLTHCTSEGEFKQFSNRDRVLHLQMNKLGSQPQQKVAILIIFFITLSCISWLGRWHSWITSTNGCFRLQWLVILRVFDQFLL